MRPRRWWLLIASLWLCASCAPISQLPDLPADEIAAEKRRQQIAQVRDYYAQLNRLDTVAFRIRSANVADCNGWVTPQIGLLAATPNSLPRRYRSFSAEALSLRWVRATVISVVDGSPAGIAGLKDQDELIAFNGEPVPTSGTMGWIGKWLAGNGTRPFEVSFKREDALMSLSVTPVTACAIPVELKVNAGGNAYTTGERIVIHSGMLRLARTDAQLALIVGHELAHANLGHIDKQEGNQLLGMAAGAAIDVSILAGGISTRGAFSREFGKAGARAFSVGFEREADYVGCYYAARAGYDLAGAEDIWRAMSLEAPNAITMASTHPISPVRFVQIQKTAGEIADKRRRNLPLVPEVKMLSVKTEPDIPPERDAIH